MVPHRLDDLVRRHRSGHRDDDLQRRQTGEPLRLGLSFTGGTDVTVKFTKPVTQEALTAALTGIKITDAQVNTLSKPGEPPTSAGRSRPRPISATTRRSCGAR